ncbi:hypothetical protein [Paenibacillus sp. DMB20]|uniref:hypothetical protein n=1 Tax=Paenibacillus sp. DMB20 TaxID=1642570 RepID=UPI00128D23C3|nr:hypothetical protein [Paenibacillus sp. DMB20]
MEQITYLLHEAEGRNSTQSLIEFALQWLKESSSYDSTPYVFQTVIFPLFDKFNQENVLKLIDIMDNNSQIYGGTKHRHLYIPVVRAKATEILGDNFHVAEHRCLQ